MPRKTAESGRLCHVISFRVSDQELKILKSLGSRTTRISGVLRQIVERICKGDKSEMGKA